MTRIQRKQQRKQAQCANCQNCRCTRGTNRHHRKPKAKGGKSTDKNIKKVSANCHKAWHTMFQDMLPEEICEKINAVWLDPDFIFYCERRPQ